MRTEEEIKEIKKRFEAFIECQGGEECLTIARAILSAQRRALEWVLGERDEF